MAGEISLYTGKLTYKDIDFTFAFDKKTLSLIPPDEMRHTITWNWGMKPIANGVFTFADPIPVNADYIVGRCNETGSNLVFIPKQGSNLSINNSVVEIELSAYVICKYDRDAIDRISFSCPEINYIHPVNQAVSYAFTPAEFDKKGIVSLTTQNFEATTTENQVFYFDEKKITSYFGISITMSSKIDEPPLSLESTLTFEFDETDDYSFVLRLWRIARNYIRFLCYRKNVYIATVDIASPYENGKHETFATMYILGQDEEPETTVLKNGRYIKQQYVAGHEGKILSDIASDNIYLRHHPETYRSGRSIDASRFVMITAAFEWEFHRLYPNGVEKSDSTINAENAVSEEIQKMINNTHGKQRAIYKFLKRLIRSDSLQSEIIQVGKDFSEIIDVFGNRLYRLNGQELKYPEMGQRLSTQRNHFAHGDLDKDFIGLALLDLIYLEYVIYAMQLKHYGVDSKKIQKSINNLFHCGLAI